jgi:hypothetical protein
MVAYAGIRITPMGSKQKMYPLIFQAPGDYLTNNTLEYLENYWWVGRRSILRMMVGRIYLDSTQERNDTGLMGQLPANHQLRVSLPLQSYLAPRIGQRWDWFEVFPLF